MLTFADRTATEKNWGGGRGDECSAYIEKALKKLENWLCDVTAVAKIDMAWQGIAGRLFLIIFFS